MPRDLPISNGSLYISYDECGILRELNFPHVGEETHTCGEPFRFGVFCEGNFSWLPDGWGIERDYLDDSLVTNVVFSNDDWQMKIRSNDCVDFFENIYVKKITVSNESDREKEVTLFLHQDFHISGTDIGDTAAFRPENNSILHYKEDRYFLINILANNKFGIDFFATGNKEKGTDKGTWKDAEDGVLSGNPIAQGSVDSVVQIPLVVPSGSETTCYYWIAAGKTWDQVRVLNDVIRQKTPEELVNRTHNYWTLWSDKEKMDPSLLPESIFRLYKRSLLICRTHIDNCGSIIAACDSDSIHFNRDTYTYMWPRDSALVAHAFDLANYSIVPFYLFCGKIISKDGYFLHKYTASGTLASSWHPWIKDHKPQLPIQEDETALVIWALWEHYVLHRDLEIIRPLYAPLIKKAADFMMNYRDMKTGLPLPSFDLWEERQGVLTFTVSTVFGGLMAAANFAEMFGEKDLAEEYRHGAEEIKQGMEKHLYLKDKNRFARMVNFHKDGTAEIDDTIDASLYGLFAFNAYPADHPFVESTMNQVYETLWSPSGGGLTRYPNDPYYHEEGTEESNPWFITTLWIAQYHIAKAKTVDDLGPAMDILQWTADHALPSGVLAEQINPRTHEPISVSPLTWSHGAFLATVQKYLRKRADLISS